MATTETTSANEAPTRIHPSPVLSPGAAEMAIETLEEYQAQLLALTFPIEDWLAKACNEGRDPPNDAPLTDRPAESMRVCMGQHLLLAAPARQESAHG